MALEFYYAQQRFLIRHRPRDKLRLRIGIHSGKKWRGLRSKKGRGGEGEQWFDTRLFHRFRSCLRRRSRPSHASILFVWRCCQHGVEDRVYRRRYSLSIYLVIVVIVRSLSIYFSSNRFERHQMNFLFLASKIHLSSEAKQFLDRFEGYDITERGSVYLKVLIPTMSYWTLCLITNVLTSCCQGKGHVITYWLNGRFMHGRRTTRTTNELEFDDLIDVM